MGSGPMSLDPMFVYAPLIAAWAGKGFFVLVVKALSGSRYLSRIQRYGPRERPQRQKKLSKAAVLLVPAAWEARLLRSPVGP